SHYRKLLIKHRLDEFNKVYKIGGDIEEKTEILPISYFDDSESIISDSTITGELVLLEENNNDETEIQNLINQLPYEDEEKINAYEYLSIKNMSHSIDISNEEIVTDIIKNNLDKESEPEIELISSSTKAIYNIQNIVKFVKYKQTELELDNKQLETLYEIQKKILIYNSKQKINNLKD
ncbi:7989_t:CDS:2, partial [Cetraspora pellucida]